MSRPIPGDSLSPIPLTHAPPPSVPVALSNMYAPNPFAVASPTRAATGGHRSLPSLAELFHSFKRRWLLAILIGGIVASVVAAAIWMVMPSGKHQVRAIVQMRASVSSGLFKDAGQDNDAFDRFKDDQLASMKKRTFLARVGNDPSVRHLPMLEGVDDKAAVYESLLSFKWESPEMLHVKMNGDDQVQLQAMLSAFVRVYVAEAKSEERSGLKRHHDLLVKSIAELTKKIEDINEKVQKDQAKNGGGVNAALEKQMIVTEINRLTGEIGRLESEEVRLTSLLTQAEGEIKGEVVLDPDQLAKAIDRDGRVEAKLAIANGFRADLAKLQKSLQPGASRLIETQLELDKALAALDVERKSVRPEIVKEVQVVRRSELTGALAKFTQEVEPIRTQLKSQKAARLTQQDQLKNLDKGIFQGSVQNLELTPLIEMRNKLITQLGDVQNILGSDETRVSIKEDAVIAENYNLKQKMVMAAGGAAAAMLGILLIISYLEWRNRRVDGVDQVVTELGMRVIGTIPAFPSRASLRNGEASQNQNWRFILNESVNSTRTMLLHTAKSQQMQIILVTSAMQGEGKTSLSSQLATSMATAGLRTLILDCDLRNPSMQKLFDIPVAPGCSEILLQEIEIADAVQPTTVPNLWIIPAGQCNHRVIAALAQGHPLEAMFDRLRGQFDIIVVDSCPILPVADTLLVAQHVDGVVFSILQDVSQLPKVQDATDRIVQLNIPLLGAVVNGIKPDTQAYGYNYVKQLPA